MAFESIEEANEYQVKVEKQLADLKQQLESQKSVLSEKDETIKSYDEQVKKLKIKNYELFEQVSSNPVQDKQKPQDDKPKMSYQEFLNKVL
ncbi:MAG: hypothetical protein ACI3T9_00035 [Romboutsia timonensis]